MVGRMARRIGRRTPSTSHLPSSADSEISWVGFDDSKAPAEIVHWLAVQLNRKPDPLDLYAAGKNAFDAGMYKASAAFLSGYVQTPNSLLPGRHLLGYALASLNQRRQAIEHLAQCANEGFDSDWQLLVELQIELMNEENQRELYLARLTANTNAALGTDAGHSANESIPEEQLDKAAVSDDNPSPLDSDRNLPLGETRLPPDEIVSTFG